MSKRSKFFLAYLTISFFIALVFSSIVLFLLYPTPLAKAVGVIHILLLIISIHVIIFPILGFVIYKEGKKTLMIDLAIIVSIQILAFLYGCYTIHQGRPVWVVFNIDQFELIRQNEIYEKNIKQAKSQFQTPIFSRPKFVAVEFSKNKDIKQQEIFDEILNGIALSTRPERYVELTQVRAQIQQRAQSLDLLNQYNNQVLVQKILGKYPQATAFVPLKSNAVDMTVLINKEKGEVIKIVDLRPWK